MDNSTKKILAIINPISGTSNKENVPDIVRQVLVDCDFDITIKFTEYAGHATELAKQAISENFYGVIAIGGDGTINEVASSLRDSNTILGIVPCGSGNGLARHLNIPIDIKKSLKIISRQIVESLDYCTVNDKPFFCTCGVGFDAHVSKKFAEAGKRGPITYLKKTIAEYLKYNSEEYIIETADAKIREKAFVTA